MPLNDCRGRSAGQSARFAVPLKRLAFGAALGALVVCANAVAARAGDDDVQSSGGSIYDKFMQTLGLEGSNGDINYSERSPLVIPPTRDLPPPSASAGPPAPGWPVDPDLTRRAKGKAAEKVGPHPDWAATLGNPLRPDQLKSSSTGTIGPNDNGATYPERLMSNKGPFGLGWFGKKEEYATFTGEPPRSRLTDPPPGYLTPSPDQPYGVAPEDKKKYKVPTVANRGDLVSGTAQNSGH